MLKVIIFPKMKEFNFSKKMSLTSTKLFKSYQIRNNLQVNGIDYKTASRKAVSVFFRTIVLSMLNISISLFSPYLRKYENGLLGSPIWSYFNDIILMQNSNGNMNLKKKKKVSTNQKKGKSKPKPKSNKKLTRRKSMLSKRGKK